MRRKKVWLAAHLLLAHRGLAQTFSFRGSTCSANTARRIYKPEHPCLENTIPSMAELKKLDVGYGYTADGGETHPFRGKGVGLMPTLSEVLARSPGEELLLHLKNDAPRDGEQLAGYLAKLPPARLEKLAVYGGDGAIASLAERLPPCARCPKRP